MILWITLRFAWCFEISIRSCGTKSWNLKRRRRRRRRHFHIVRKHPWFSKEKNMHLERQQPTLILCSVPALYVKHFEVIRLLYVWRNFKCLNWLEKKKHTQPETKKETLTKATALTSTSFLHSECTFCFSFDRSQQLRNTKFVHRQWLLVAGLTRLSHTTILYKSVMQFCIK